MKTEILLFAAAMAVRLCVPPAAAFVPDSVPPPPEAPGPGAWDFKREFAEPEEGADADLTRVRFVRGKVAGFESYRVDVSPDGGITVTTEDDEGRRRAVYHVRDRLRAGDLKSVTRRPWVRNRISRCFFGPIKRPPFNRDELMDDTDYYPDAYLDRLAHEGVNGLWLTVEFRDLAATSFTKRGKDAVRRLAKLRRTVEKCRRYGIKTWLFAIEPHEVDVHKDPLALAHPDWIGCVYDGQWGTLCTAHPEVKRYLEESARDIFTQVPGLGGLINISNGECVTSCLSLIDHPQWFHCPRCTKLKPWEIHTCTVSAMIRGMRAADPSLELISWIYRSAPFAELPEWVYESAANLPEGVIQQNNFETGVILMQEGRPLIGGDYWLSCVGPSIPFKRVATEARRAGREVSAKLQVSCSHEIATIPVVPVPGLLYRKYRAMRELGVSNVMQCWYFGSAPGIMNKAAGELAFEEFNDDEAAFLERLARPDWGDDAPAMARLWRAYSDGYENYPLSNHVQYYGPFHQGTVWPLRPDIELRPLGDSWVAMQPPGGDLIGECLKDFTLGEVLSLTRKMCSETVVTNAAGGDALSALEGKYAGNRNRSRDLGLIRALKDQWESAKNVFEFYYVRREAVTAGRDRQDPAAALRAVARMREIATREKAVTAEMKKLSENDSRLGFHSEAESHQYFPAYFAWRLGTLDGTLARLDAIGTALKEGKGYPFSELEKKAPVFPARLDAQGNLVIEGEAKGKGTVTVWLYDTCGTRGARPYTAEPENGRFSLIIPPLDWNDDPRLRPGWIQIHQACHWMGDSWQWPPHPAFKWRWHQRDLLGYYSARLIYR